MNPRRDSFPRARRPSDDNPSPSQVAAGDVVTFVFGKWRKAANLFTKAAAPWKDTGQCWPLGYPLPMRTLADETGSADDTRSQPSPGSLDTVAKNVGQSDQEANIEHFAVRCIVAEPCFGAASIAGINPGPQRFPFQSAPAELFTRRASTAVVCLLVSIGRHINACEGSP